MTDSQSIAGDFLSLLVARKLPALNAEGAVHAPVQTQATTVFAFHFAGGVLMAGDRRATAGNVIVTDRVDKVIEIDAHSMLAIAGVPATASIAPSAETIAAPRRAISHLRDGALFTWARRSST